jgi:uncharacterized membrane protein (DUF2068 family)
MSTTATPQLDRDARYLRWIAGFNLLKGILLFAFAVGVLRFLHKDIDEIVGSWMAALRFDLENRHIARLLERLDLVTDRQLKQLSGVTFAYAGVFLTEGVGLLLRQTWAKYMTLLVASSFVPLELFETIRHFGWPILMVLATNVAIVGFLIANLRHVRAQRSPHGASLRGVFVDSAS